MKKNVLALSITAAVAAIGFAGSAQAMSVAPLSGATANSILSMNKDGIGHMLLVPYFTAQAENTTLVNITNTDTINAKAVKVRFRAAANSDDVFDFQVFLSPGDVYAFNVAKALDGSTKFTTNDASCSKPEKAELNKTPFVTSRVDSTLTGDALLNQAREGYIEIFNMADIPRAATGVGDLHAYQPLNMFNGQNSAGPDLNGDGVNDLYTAIKHVNGVAPCGNAAWEALNANDPTDPTNARTYGLLPPSTGLMANWTIINVVGAAAWSGAAPAIQAVADHATFFTEDAVLGNVVYWPQVSKTVSADSALLFTADPLFRKDALKVTNANNNVAVAADVPALTASFYDLPDMSTPYSAVAGGSGVNANTVSNVLRPLVQAKKLTEVLASTSIINEFLTDATIGAMTDWVVSMPTRRYSVAMNYKATISATEDGRRFSELVDDGVSTTLSRGYFIPKNTTVEARQICVTGVGGDPRDREENFTTSVVKVVISPSVPGKVAPFCGETSVVTINNSKGVGSLKASVAVKDITTPYTDGWMILTTPSGGAVDNGPAGLPVIGSAFSKANGAGAQTYGAAWPHRNGRLLAQ